MSDQNSVFQINLKDLLQAMDTAGKALVDFNTSLEHAADAVNKVVDILDMAMTTGNAAETPAGSAMYERGQLQNVSVARGIETPLNEESQARIKRLAEAEEAQENLDAPRQAKNTYTLAEEAMSDAGHVLAGQHKGDDRKPESMGTGNIPNLSDAMLIEDTKSLALWLEKDTADLMDFDNCVVDATTALREFILNAGTYLNHAPQTHQSETNVSDDISLTLKRMELDIGDIKSLAGSSGDNKNEKQSKAIEDLIPEPGKYVAKILNFADAFIPENKVTKESLGLTQWANTAASALLKLSVWRSTPALYSAIPESAIKGVQVFGDGEDVHEYYGKTDINKRFQEFVDGRLPRYRIDKPEDVNNLLSGKAHELTLSESGTDLSKILDEFVEQNKSELEELNYDLKSALLPGVDNYGKTDISNARLYRNFTGAGIKINEYLAADEPTQNEHAGMHWSAPNNKWVPNKKANPDTTHKTLSQMQSSVTGQNIKNYNIKIGTLGQISMNVKTLVESKTDIKRAITDWLMDALHDSELTA